MLEAGRERCEAAAIARCVEGADEGGDEADAGAARRECKVPAVLVFVSLPLPLPLLPRAGVAAGCRSDSGLLGSLPPLRLLPSLPLLLALAPLLLALALLPPLALLVPFAVLLLPRPLQLPLPLLLLRGDGLPAALLLRLDEAGLDPPPPPPPPSPPPPPPPPSPPPLPLPPPRSLSPLTPGTILARRSVLATEVAGECGRESPPAEVMVHIVRALVGIEGGSAATDSGG